MALRTLIIGNAGTSTWTTTVSTVSITSWPITATSLTMNDTSDMNTFTLVGTAKTPATTTVTIKKQVFTGGNYVLYYMSVKSGGTSISYEDPLDGDTVTQLLNDIKTAITDGSGFSLLSNATYGLSALKTAITNVDTKVTTVDTVVDAIKLKTDLLDNATYGLSAIHTDVETVKTYTDILDDGTNGLAAIKGAVNTVDTVVDAIKVQSDKINDATIGLSAIRTAINTVDTVVDAIKVETDKIVTVDTVIDAIKVQTDKIANATYGLAALKTAIDLVQTGVTENGTDLSGLSDFIQANLNQSGLIMTSLKRLNTIRYILNGTLFTPVDGENGTE